MKSSENSSNFQKKDFFFFFQTGDFFSVLHAVYLNLLFF